MSRAITPEIEQRLRALPGGDKYPIEGAAEADVCALESEIGRRLPAVYRDFLKSMGHSAGRLFRGSDYAISQPHRLRLRDAAEEVLKRSGAEYVLPNDAFVFLMHHGYQFFFFHLTRDDDPEIYRFADDDILPRKVARSFSDFLRNLIEDHERIVERRQDADSAIAATRA